MWINKTIIKPLAFSVFTYVCCIPKLNSTIVPNCYSCCVIKLWFIFPCSHNIYELQFFLLKLLNLPFPPTSFSLAPAVFVLGSERSTDAYRCVKIKHWLSPASMLVNQSFICYRVLVVSGSCVSVPWICCCSAESQFQMQRVQNSSIVLCCVVHIHSPFLLEERQMKGKKQIQKPKRRGAYMGKKTTKQQKTHHPTVFRGLCKQGVKMNEHELFPKVLKAGAQAVVGVCCRMREGLGAELLGQTLWAGNLSSCPASPFHPLTLADRAQSLWGCCGGSPGTGLKQKDCIIGADWRWSPSDGTQGHLSMVLFSELFLSRARKFRVNTG